MPSRRVRVREAVPGPPAGFLPPALQAAEQAVNVPRLPERNLTELEVVTIDPHGSKDLDQALYIYAAAPAGARDERWYALVEERGTSDGTRWLRSEVRAMVRVG